jgi:thymidylate synthase
MRHWHQTFASAYLEGLEELLHAGGKVSGVRDRHSIGSQFGDENRLTIELLSHAFTVADPYACLLEGGTRRPREAYVAGQWLWVMSGSDDAEHISFYNPRGHEFADAEGRLGGAFGARMRRSGGDQLGRAIERLRRDPSSRRAVITIAEPSDGRVPSRDFPCALAVQLMIRGGKLEAITNMRSQSALTVLPYDAALMMMVQLWAAGELGLEAGPHHWTANSFHVYGDEVATAEAVLSDPPTFKRLPAAGGGGEALLRSLFSYESDLRRAVTTERRHSDEVKVPPALVRDDELLGWVAATLRRHAAQREESISRLEGHATQ